MAQAFSSEARNSVDQTIDQKSHHTWEEDSDSTRIIRFQPLLPRKMGSCTVDSKARGNIIFELSTLGMLSVRVALNVIPQGRLFFGATVDVALPRRLRFSFYSE